MFSDLVQAKVQIPEIKHGDLPGTPPVNNFYQENFLHSILPNFIQWSLGFFASIAILVIMIGGYMHLTSFGGEQTEKAKKTILYAVIGLILIILSYAIVSIVQSLEFF